MKLRLLLITGILAFFGHLAQAQCAAYGYFTQSGSTAVFYDSSYSANGHFSYWDFGDGSSGGYGTQVSHTYTANGTYTASLYIYDSLANCDDTTFFNITISSVSNCNASISYSVDSINSLQYYFYGSNPVAGGSASITVWDFGNNDTTYNSQFATHTFPSAGSYRVYYILYDSSGQFCDSTEITLAVSGGSTTSCNATFTYSVDSSNPYKLNFNNTSTNAVSAYWWFGGSTSSSSYNPSHTFNTSGYQTVCLTTYDSLNNLCDSICQTVYVPGQTSNTSCDASFYAFTQQGTTYFYDSTTQNSIIEYSFGDGSYGYISSPSHTYANSGTYNACLFVYDVDSIGDTLLCDSFCQTITIAAASSCNASFAYYIDSINMSASSFPVLFTNNSTGTNFLWNFGDGSTDTARGPNHVYSNPGTYTVCLYVLTGYDSLGLPVICDSTCSSITVGSTSSGCTATISYTVDSLNSNRYYFSGNNPPAGGWAQWIVVEGGTNVSYYSGTSMVHTFSSAGTFFVEYDLHNPDSSFCDSTSTYVTVSNACQASYYLGLDTNNLYNLYIINNSTGTSSSTSYSWSFGDGSTSTAQYPTHQYSSFGLYNLCLTISDSASGCSSTYCDSIGLDSNGNLLKRDGFGITVVDESDLTSVTKTSLIEGLNVYPNPSTGRYTVQLSLKSAETISLRAMNSLGQEVLASEYNGTTGANELGIDMSTHPNGMYFLRLRAGDQTKNVKIYINR